jgi:Protein of unknown function (DUF2934)
MKTTTKTTQGSNRREPNRPTQATATFQSHLPETSNKQDIAKLAYALWQHRGCPYGTPDFDWFEAERKLRQSSEHVSR